MIRDGKVAEPVKGATLIGNGGEILKKIDMVGNDLMRPKACAARCRVPSRPTSGNRPCASAK
jgi:TldD protein